MKEEFEEHCTGMNVDGDSILYPSGVYAELSRKATSPYLMLRNNVWECVIDYFSTYSTTIDDLLKNICGDDNLIMESIKKWLDWVNSDPLNNEISLWDRIYWDLRTGCWLSSIEQSLDMVDDLTVVQMCNSRLILSHIHQFDLEKRKRKAHNDMLISQLCPRLSGIPYSMEYRSLGEKIRCLLKRVKMKAKLKIKKII